MTRSVSTDSISRRICTECDRERGQQSLCIPRLALAGQSSGLVLAFGYVDFDLQLGPKIVDIFPQIPLSVEEEKELSFLCFPDANFGPGEDVSFHDFVSSLDLSGFRSSDAGQLFECFNSRQDYFCTSLFSRIKHSDAERGAHQSALFCITQIPLPDVARAMLETLYSYLSEGRASVGRLEVLERAFVDSQGWRLVSDERCLCFMGRPLDVFSSRLLPSDFCGMQWSGESSSFSLFGPRTPAEDLIEIVEHEQLTQKSKETAPGFDDSDTSQWPRILGKIQMLPPNVRSECLSILKVGTGGWDGVSFSFVPVAGTLEALSRALRGSEGGLRDPSPENGTHPHLLFRNASFFPPEIVYLQNSNLWSLLGSASEIIRSAVVSEESSQTRCAIGDISHLYLDLPVPFSESASLCETLWPHCARVYKLWELMVSGESVLVLAADVGVASQACLSIIALLSPIRFEGVLRPYLTASNRDADRLLLRTPPMVQSVVGVTNPFFAEKCSLWRNVLCFGPRAQRPVTAAATSNYAKIHHGSGKVSATTPSSRAMMQFSLQDAMFSSAIFSVRVESLASKIPGDVASEDVLRKRLRLLTVSFLKPLHDFIVSTLRKYRPFFSHGNWQHSLIGTGAVVAFLEGSMRLPVDLFRSRSDLLRLYKLFIGTPSYYRWRQALSDSVEREIIIEANSLEDLLLLDPSPQSRHQVLSYLQTKLSRALAARMHDIDLLKALAHHLTGVCALRELLCQQRCR